MRTWLLPLLLIPVATLASAAPLRVVNLCGDTAALPIQAALESLGGRMVSAPPSELATAGRGTVVLLDGASDLAKLPGENLEAFVNRGGGVLVAGLPDALPRTAGLLNALGAATPADLPAASLFPSDAGNWIWIGMQAGETADHTRYIRRTFEVTKPLRRAFVRCTADNLYTVYLNGEEIGHEWSWYDHELWDVKDKVRPGRNVLAFKARNVDGPGGFFAQLGLEYEDGTRELIVSDQSFKFSVSEQPGWNTLGYDDSAWRPATESQPMERYTRIYDRGLKVAGPLQFGPAHPLLNGLTDRFGQSFSLRAVAPRPGAVTLLSAGGQPVLLARDSGAGRALLLNALPDGTLGASDLADDLLATAVLWLGGQTEGMTVTGPTYPPAVLRRGGGVRLSYDLGQVLPVVDGTLTATLVHGGKSTVVGKYALHAGQATAAAWQGEETRDASADGAWNLQLVATDAAGATLFSRSLTTEVISPLSLPSNRHVVAKGQTVTFQGDLAGLVGAGKTVRAAIVDPWGRELTELQPSVQGEAYTWSYAVPDLAEGDYRLVVTLTAGGTVADSFGAAFTVVPRLDLADFYPTTMRLSPSVAGNRVAMEREIDDILAHGFNTLTFSAHRLGAKPGGPHDYAEDYAQRRGMAVSYSFQGDFCLLQREGLPSVSVFSPEYKEAIRPKIEAAVATCRQVPRLLNVQGYMDEPFQVSGATFDTRPPAREEFRRRYGIEMPTREEARRDPALWLKYVDFWSDCFATGWRQSYAMVKDLDPDFWVELTHDSHCTFGAAGRDFRGFWAVDDVYHWGAPFDSVNYDIYPYLSTDFRSGKFQEHRLPRIAGMHMAFAETRNLAYAYDKKLGFWVESGWNANLAPDAPGRKAPWSPRELTYTAVAAGCDYLNTFWGLPEDPAWWETYRGVMNELKAVAPLLTRSRVPQAKAAFVFPRTQHVLLQEEYWNVMVSLEAFRQAYGELDCLHEEQIAKGGLKPYQALVLFDIHLLKRADAQAIRDWVQAGGRLLVDEIPSLDENKQPLGVFEPLFGVKGTAAVQEGAVALPGTKVQLWGKRSYETGELALRRSCGRGQATLLNFPVKDCYLDALVREDGAPAAAAIRSLLRQATVDGTHQPNVTSTTPGIEAALRLTKQGTALLLLVNHESKEATTTVTLPNLPAGGTVRDLVTGKPVKAGAKYAMTLQCPWGQTRLLGVFPSAPAGLRLEGLKATYAAGQQVDAHFVLGGRNVRGNMLLDVTVTGPDGRTYQAFSGRTCSENAACRRTFTLPVNAQPGKWAVSGKSLWDGTVAKGSFVVK